MYSLWEANERRKPIITCGYDLMPEFAGEKLELTEEDIINLVQKNLGDGVAFQEAVFIPRVNIILFSYEKEKRSRIIFVTKEAQLIEDFGDLSLENIDDFDFDKLIIKELRYEDYDNVSGGLEAIIQIKVKNQEKK